MAGFGPNFASITGGSDLLKGMYIGPEKLNTCETPMRPGALARSRKQRGGSRSSRKNRSRKQRGGGCGCMPVKRQRGGASVQRKKKGPSKKQQQRQQQRGGAGYTFGLSDLSLGGKMAPVMPTPCPKPLPGFYPPIQTGGGPLVGSDISSLTQPLAGTTQLVNPALYNSSPAGVQLKMGLTSVFGAEKIPYPQVDSITARSSCSAPMLRRRSRSRRSSRRS
jgi:hypothetical protein